jgi:hypothetical protein
MEGISFGELMNALAEPPSIGEVSPVAISADLTAPSLGSGLVGASEQDRAASKVPGRRNLENFPCKPRLCVKCSIGFHTATSGCCGCC